MASRPNAWPRTSAKSRESADPVAAGGPVRSRRSTYLRVGPGRPARQRVDELAERACSSHDRASHEQRLGSAGRRHDHCGRGDRVGERECAGHRSDRAVEAELSDECTTGDGSRLELSGGDEKPDRDRQIEAGAGFANPGGCEVHSYRAATAKEDRWRAGRLGHGRVLPGRRRRAGPPPRSRAGRWKRGPRPGQGGREHRARWRMG